MKELFTGWCICEHSHISHRCCQTVPTVMHWSLH